jgi:hypothetical protein
VVVTVKLAGLPTTAAAEVAEVNAGATPMPTGTVTWALSRPTVTDPAPVAEFFVNVMDAVPALIAAELGVTAAPAGVNPTRATDAPVNADRFADATAAPLESVRRLDEMVDEVFPGRISAGDAVALSFR